jgi:hypothetical protein
MMKTTLIRIFLFFSLSTILFTACNKESFIETVGQTSIESAESEEVGYFIFSSKTKVASCGKLTIWLNGKEAGQITSDYSGSISTCTTPPVEGKLIKIVAPVGTYKVEVKGEKDCTTYTDNDYVLKVGVCRFYGFN